MTIAQIRAQAKVLHDQAQAIYVQHRDSEGGMPDEAATRYDGLLDQRDGLIRQANEQEVRENRLNDAAAVFQGELRDGGFAAGMLPHNDPGNTRNGKHRYSVNKAISESIRGGLTGLEDETHKSLNDLKVRSGGQPARGVMIPWDIAVSASGESRAFDTTAGTGSIAKILSGSMIDLLRAKMVTAQMGATVMADMVGTFAISRQSAAATAYWVAESGSPTASNQTIDQVTFTPKTVGGYTDVSRRLILQSSLDAENIVRRDLVEVVARGLELAGLYGSGSSNQPTGVGQMSGVTTVPLGTNGAIPTWAWLVAMESAVANANADMGALGYVFNSATRGIMKTTAKIGSTFPVYLWDVNDPATPVNGYKVGISNLIPSNLTKGSSTSICSLGLFGNWNDLIFALWSGIDILADPYTGSTSGTVRLVALQDADLNVRHPESFTKCVDILTA